MEIARISFVLSLLLPPSFTCAILFQLIFDSAATFVKSNEMRLERRETAREVMAMAMAATGVERNE